MKKGATPELRQKWWKDNKAKTLKKTGLGAALKDYEVAEKLSNYKRMLKALDAVKKKARTAEGACVKKLHDETLAALQRYPRIIQEKEVGIRRDIKWEEVEEGKGEDKMELVYTEIRTKGFDSKWWKTKAARNCRGIGVENALDKCTKALIGKNGLVKEGDIKNMRQFNDANKAYHILDLNLNTAKKKCGVYQAQTKEGIEKYYLPRIVEAQKYLRDSYEVIKARDEKTDEFKALMWEKADLEIELKYIKKIAKKVDQGRQKINKRTSALDDAVEKGVWEGPDRGKKLNRLYADAKFEGMEEETERLQKILGELDKKLKITKQKYFQHRKMIKPTEDVLAVLGKVLSTIEGNLDRLVDRAGEIAKGS